MEEEKKNNIPEGIEGQKDQENQNNQENQTDKTSKVSDDQIADNKEVVSEHSEEKEKTTQEVAVENAATEALSDIQRLDVSLVTKSAQKIKNELAKVVIGQEDLMDMLIASIMVGGHCLIEGLPGIAKTLTARSLARSIDSTYSRIQFTPDLMPTDVSGTSVFNVKESDFYFKKGPIFASIVLIDEINRSPAKTQAALMEIMEEQQLTYDGTTYPMEQPFIVIATQNPIEQEGTYQLPEAQLDRFIFRIKVEYPNLYEEQAILRMYQNDFKGRREETINKVLTKDQVLACRKLVEQVHIKDDLLDYIASIVDNTRNNGDIFLGASPRASLAIMKTSKAIAAMRGRDFVTPDDIQHVCYPVLNHRIVLSYEREMEGSTVEDIIKNILLEIEVPR